MTYFLQCVDHWQTLITGLLALSAAWLTIRSTNKAATREISAAQEQTKVAQEQIAVTKLLERRRIARESYAFFAMLEAAMVCIVEDVEAARKIFKGPGDSRRTAYAARQRVKKPAFEDLRTACLHSGGQLTKPFLRLDKEIDDFAAQYTTESNVVPSITFDEEAGLDDQLLSIEQQAVSLRDEARNEMERCTAVLAETESVPAP